MNSSVSPTPLPALRVELLGGLRVTLGGRPVELPPARRARSLFAYLAAHAERAHSRDELGGVFWPDGSESEARRHLSQALWRLRRALGAPGRDWIVTGGDTAGLATLGPLWTDLAAFETAVCEAEAGVDPAPAEAAIQLYRGELLPGWQDAWLLPLRGRAQELYLRLLARLVELRRARGEYALALEQARALTRADELHEPGHREVLRLLVLLGRPLDARRHYHQFRELLRLELGTEPDPETQRLAAPLAELPRPGGAPPPFLGGEERVPLVGRAAEGTALREVVASPGAAALLAGEPGIGKTRLLREALESARWHGLEAVVARPPEGAATPYGTLRALLAEVSPHVLRAAAGELAEVWRRDAGLVVPELGAGGPAVPLGAAASRERLREALTRAVLAVGRVTPLVVLLDDLHRADEDSLDVLRRLGARREGDLRLVLAYRDDEARARPPVWSVLETFARVGARRLTLGPLEEAESGLLVRRGLGLARPDPALEAALYRTTHGHPLLVRETVRALFEAGEVRPDGAGGWTLPVGRLGEAAPAALEAVVGARFARLGRVERHLTHLAAVLAAPFTLDVLLRAAGEDTPAVLAATAALVRAGWWVQGGGLYRFGHDHLRRVAEARLPPGLRPALHMRVAEALEEGGSAAWGDLAHHFELAGQPVRAAAYHRRAAEAAAELHAYGDAARHDRAWLALAGETAPPEDAHFAVLLRLEETSGVLGDVATREEMLSALHARAGGRPARELEVALRRSQLLRETGRLAGAQAAAREALDWAARQGEPAGRARALLALGRAILDRGAYREAVGPLREATEGFRAAGDAGGEGQAQCALSVAWSELGERTATLAELEAALARFRRGDDLRWEGEVLGWLASEHMERGDLRLAERYFGEALKLARRIGHRRLEATVLMNWATLWTAVQNRRRAGAAEHYRQATAILSDLGERRGEAYARAGASGALIMLGDFEEARVQARAALGFFREIGHRASEAQCLAELANLAREEGDFRAARTHLDEALACVRTSGGRYLEAQVHLALAELALAEGRPPGALAHLETAAELSHAHALQSLDPDTLALRSQALLALGDPPAALNAAEDALGRHAGEAAPPFWHLYTRFQARAAAGDPEADLDLDRAHASLLESLADLAPEEARRSLTRVAAHRRVVEAWEARHLRREQVSLPAASIPGGRAPRAGEWVSVTWTAASPDDLPGGSVRARRQHRLRRLLAEAGEQGGAPGVRDLAGLLGVSVATVKRDLAELRAAGERLRTRRRG